MMVVVDAVIVTAAAVIIVVLDIFAVVATAAVDIVVVAVTNSIFDMHTPMVAFPSCSFSQPFRPYPVHDLGQR